MTIDRSQVEATIARYNERQARRERNQRLIDDGRYFDADEPARVEKWLSRRGVGPRDAAAILRRPARGVPAAAAEVEGHFEPNALERILGTNDLMGVAFLEGGLRAARSVARVWINVSGSRPAGFGTGFLVSSRLLLTNHHVLGDAATARSSLVEFNYQRDLRGQLVGSQSFALDPSAFFFADRRLDYALVAVQPAAPNGAELGRFGWNPLIENQGKAIVSQWLNIIQHPAGEPKQLALRENQLVDLLDDFLHYTSDTAPGSSGSPVYNDRWEVVGLHHSGVWATNQAGQILAVDGSLWKPHMGEQRIKWIANEGVRISRIIAHLRGQNMTTAQKRLFEDVFLAPPEVIAEGGSETGPPGPPRSRAPDAVCGPEGPATVSVDGTCVWTIPLTVAVRLGGGAVPCGSAAPPVPPPLPAVEAPPAPPEPAGDTTLDLDSVVEAARQELLARADVLGVRLGYVFENGWITKRRALVVTVRQRRDPAALREANVAPLPLVYRGLPVEVTNPGLDEVIELARGVAVAREALGGDEVLPTEITYRPPPGQMLKQVKAKMRVVAHVSPDAGWPQLAAFLGKTRQSLVVGMYDFGAQHIVEAMRTAGQRPGFKRLLLVMQKGENVGSGTKRHDLRDTEVVADFREHLGDKFQNAWVQIGVVNGWVASSYHIKVAVRDESAFWLSSGNMQSSNQPPADPLSEDPPRRFWLDRYNREWHAIVQHAGLAKQFAAYLEHDFANNVDVSPREALDLPDLLIPESYFAPSPAEAAAPFQYFPPFEEEREFAVTPLLTPDEASYHEQVLKLVSSAEHELLIQNQTFNAPGSGQERLRELVEAVRQRQRAGVAVRVIFRVLFPANARRNLEQLVDMGFEPDTFKLHKNCHTKGIVVDRKRILLGSHNWSNQGVSVNRDASLLFDDEPLAEYFAKIFEHDWDKMAHRNIGSESLPVEWIAADEATPAGMVRLAWKDYLELQ